MNMKLSRRDRVIILIVAVVVIIGIGISLLLKPRYEDMQASEARLAAKQQELDQLNEKINSLPDKKATLEDKVDTVMEEQTQFLSEKAYNNEKEYKEIYQIDGYLKELLADTNIDITGIMSENITPDALAEYHYDYNALAYDMKINADLPHELPDEVYYMYNNNYPAGDAGANLGHTIAVVKYECDEIDAVYAAIDAVAASEKNIYLRTCEASLAELEVDENGVEARIEGELVIDIYTLYPMDKNDLDKDIPLTTAETDGEAAVQ